MPQETIILILYCCIADTLTDQDNKHTQGHLYLSEIVLCGVLYALKGTSFRRFYWWLKQQHLFASLPERSRLQRILIDKQAYCKRFLADQTLFTVLDSFGVEVIHPMRENRSKQSQKVSKKGLSNHRWIIGRKIAVTLNQNMQVVCASDDTANVHDSKFNLAHHLLDSITLADQCFKQQNNTPTNFKICKKGTWNDRMLIETLFSLWTRICHMKKSFHRSVKGFQAKIAYLFSLTNIAFSNNPSLGFNTLSLVQWPI